jgi:type II secretory pathway predicted ATPase ExeA
MKQIAETSVVGAPATIWLGEPLREAVQAVETAVRGEGGLIVVTGDVGVGKTTLARALLERLGDTAIVASLLYPHVRAAELRAVLRDAWAAGADVETREAFFKAIDTALDAADTGKQSLVLLVDEAQGLTPEALDEIAALLHHAAARPQLSVLLIGQEELESVLGASPLQGQIRLHQRIRTLAEREIQDYVTARRGVSLTAAESREIARASRGVPRLIERLCDNREAARLAATARTRPASEDDDEATTDGGAHPASMWRRARWIVPAGVGLAVAGLAVWWVAGLPQRDASAPAQVSAPAPTAESQPAAGTGSATSEVAPAAVGALAGPGAPETSLPTGSSTGAATAVPAPPAVAPRAETATTVRPAVPPTETAQAPTAPRRDTPAGGTSATPRVETGPGSTPATLRTENAPATPADSAPATPRPAMPPARATTQPRTTTKPETPRATAVPEVKQAEPVRPRPTPEARPEAAPRTVAPPAVVPPASRAESPRPRTAPEPRRNDAGTRDRGDDDDPGAVIDWLLRERR